MKFFGAFGVTLSVLAATALAAPAAVHSDTNRHDLTSLSFRGLTDSNGLSIRSTTHNDPTPTALFLAKRSVHINAILNAIIESNTKVIVKALLKLKLDLCADIHAKVKVSASGLLATNIGLVVPKISARVDSETNAAINTKVELDTQSLVRDKIRQHGLHAIHKHCPRGDDACLRKYAREIVDCIERAIEQDVLHLFVALKANLMTHVRAKVAVAVRDLGVNLLLEQVHVQAVVDAVTEVDTHLAMCSHAIVKGLHAEVRPNAVSVIKSVCRSSR
ncbi:hypothetical protein BGZ95_003480 [Linnemannia exigua]|uniref:Uncharacterized protein n=1 Tax=Linnemannia exigua TaxID=604196 RepID=A0AAD4DLR0_9FUNG|nr:hypothetical protein BGZ95_003480 [Linnemannia exigua]